MSNWRQYKNKVMKFINNNPYLINHNIIKIIPKTRKNTWNEIKEDLKRQYLIEYNRRKSIRSKRQEQKSKPIDFIQSNIFAEPKEINEPYYPDIVSRSHLFQSGILESKSYQGPKSRCNGLQSPLCCESLPDKYLSSAQ